jgi:MFS superfamily sulfate permease-like transporter
MGDWLPKSALCLKDYTPRLFVADLLAGITVGLVALPLAMAFAIAKQLSVAPDAVFLSKPFSKASLLASVHAVLHR